MTGGRNLEFIHVHPCPSVASLIKPFVYRVCSQGGRPLSEELSVTRRIAKLFATTVQDLLKLRHHSRSKTQSVTDCFLVQINHIMKTRFNLFRRAGVFYTEDTTTGKQTSLRTRDETEAKSLLNARNEAQLVNDNYSCLPVASFENVTKIEPLQECHFFVCFCSCLTRWSARRRA
jgi:hypothetical protein